MRNLIDKLGKIEYFLDQRTSEFDNKYINFGSLLYIKSILEVLYTSLLNSWWTQTILETYKFRSFFSVMNFGNHLHKKIS